MTSTNINRFIFISFISLSTILQGQGVPNSYNEYFEQPVFNKAVAKVGDVEITAEEFFYSYEFGPAFIKKGKDSKERHLKYMINEKLLAEDGYSRNIDTSAQVKEMFDAFVDDLATEELFKDEILSKVSIADGEVDTVMSQKQLELELKWIFTQSKDEMIRLHSEMIGGISFDSLYNVQFSDSVFKSDRYMKTDRYKLQKNNPALAQIIDTLKIGDITAPIHTNDGWYLMKIDNVWRNMITTEADRAKLREESVRGITQRKMDEISDEYVHNLLLEHEPVIKGVAFSIARSYIGEFQLPREKFEEWKLSEKLNEALEKIEPAERSDLASQSLVEMDNQNVTLKDFMIWYRTRDQYLKFNKADINTFSASLEQYIWQMLRDDLLAEVAKEKGYYSKDIVKKQAKWWKDKIVYSSVRNELTNAVILEAGELGENKLASRDNTKTDGEIISQELAVKMFRTVNKLKEQYPVTINNDVLSSIKVTSENDPTAVEVYSVKKGGLIPRPAYPTIDFDWQSWE